MVMAVIDTDRRPVPCLKDGHLVAWGAMGRKWRFASQGKFGNAAQASTAPVEAQHDENFALH